ncbi:MAG: hypothetical protein ACE5Z5_04050, partial [Candidatus Bathyarchaeia archaeon]
CCFNDSRKEEKTERPVGSSQRWTFESPDGKTLRIQGKFDEAFVQFQILSIVNLAKFFPLILVDTGEMSKENEDIARVFTHAVLLIASSYPEQVHTVWEGWVRSLGLEVIGVWTTTPQNLEQVAQQILSKLEVFFSYNEKSHIEGIERGPIFWSYDHHHFRSQRETPYRGN